VLKKDSLSREVGLNLVEIIKIKSNEMLVISWVGEKQIKMSKTSEGKGYMRRVHGGYRCLATQGRVYILYMRWEIMRTDKEAQGS